MEAAMESAAGRFSMADSSQPSPRLFAPDNVDPPPGKQMIKYPPAAWFPSLDGGGWRNDQPRIVIERYGDLP
ncbi:MAG: hypothetical protein ACJ79W_00105, partial [Myxococcales bacterium]